MLPRCGGAEPDCSGVGWRWGHNRWPRRNRPMPQAQAERSGTRRIPRVARPTPQLAPVGMVGLPDPSMAMIGSPTLSDSGPSG